MAIRKSDLNKNYRRKSAERAPGEIDFGKGKEAAAGAGEGKPARTNARTTVKAYSIRNDLIERLNDYRFTHREPSISGIVNQAIERFLDQKGA